MISFWFNNARPVSLPQSLMPAFVACVAAAGYPDFKWYLAVLCFFGIAFAHLTINLLDDLFDYLNAEQGERNSLVREGMRARTIKCQALQDGTVNPWQWLFACCIFGAIALAFGLPVIIMRGWKIIVILLITAFLGFFYSAAPFKLSYRGLGELVIGIVFGPLLFIGTCTGASGEFHAGDVLVAVCLGMLVVNILYVHSVLDYAADQRAGKNTLAWLVRTENNRYLVLCVINIIPYLLVAAGMIFGVLNIWYLLSFLTLPWSIALLHSMFRFRKDPFSKEKKKKWYGRFSNWDQIREAGLDWFMLRWYLAQKINTVFSILCIAALILKYLIR